MTTPFLDVADSGTALNKGAYVLSADVGVEKLEFSPGWELPGLLLQRQQLLKWHCAFSLAVRRVCYCLETNDFVQQVSVMVVFVTKLCDPLWLDCAIVEGSQSVTAGTNSGSILAGGIAIRSLWIITRSTTCLLGTHIGMQTDLR